MQLEKMLLNMIQNIQKTQEMMQFVQRVVKYILRIQIYGSVVTNVYVGMTLNMHEVEKQESSPGQLCL